jgi:hypothetical protein
MANDLAEAQTWYRKQGEIMWWPQIINIYNKFKQAMLKTTGVVHQGSKRINLFSYNTSHAKIGYVHNTSVQILKGKFNDLTIIHINS